MLVQTAAGLLGGDRVDVDVVVGPGAALELTTLAATIAHPATEPAHQSLAATVAAGGRFAWLPQPLVLAAGCDVVTVVELELAAGAAALIRELVVLGRDGEDAGRCRGATRCDLAGVPLLRDALEIRAGSRASPVELDGARALASLALLGLEPDGPAPPGEMALAGPGRLWRALAPDAAELVRALAPAEAAYRAHLDAPRSSEPSVAIVAMV